MVLFWNRNCAWIAAPRLARHCSRPTSTAFHLNTDCGRYWSTVFTACSLYYRMYSLDFSSFSIRISIHTSPTLSCTRSFENGRLAVLNIHAIITCIYFVRCIKRTLRFRRMKKRSIKPNKIQTWKCKSIFFHFGFFCSVVLRFFLRNRSVEVLTQCTK
jgi:hypothetical protein